MNHIGTMTGRYLTDRLILDVVDSRIRYATSPRVEISMHIYRAFLGQQAKASNNPVGLVSVRRLRAARKKFVAAMIARKLGGR